MPDTNVLLPEHSPRLPGICQMSEEDYHSGPGISKSGLWTIHDKTPFHFKYGSKETTDAMAFGSAAHCAILEPGLFDLKFYRGPVDRRGNKWKAGQEIAASTGRECLTEGDFDTALRLRDVLQRNEIVRRLTAGTPSIEQSAFWIDRKTGELCKCRPDIYNHDSNIMGDIKSTTDASARAFKKRIREKGYFVQEAWYRAGWQHAGGGKVDAFVFIAIEKAAPHASAVYELPERALKMGQRIARHALDRYHHCNTQGAWPSYSAEILELDMDDFAYRDEEARLSGMPIGLAAAAA
jgi:hypothetical protein